MKTIDNLRTYCGPYGDKIYALTGLKKEAIAEMIFLGGTELLDEIKELYGENVYYAVNTSTAFWNGIKLRWYSADADFIRLGILPTAYFSYHKRWNAINPITRLFKGNAHAAIIEE